MTDLPTPELADEEGEAATLLRAVELEDLHQVDVTVVFSELGIVPSPRAVRGCAGFERKPGHQLPDRVHFAQHGSPLRQQELGGHEVGHLAKALAFAAEPHDEASAARVGLMTRVPRAPLLQLYDGLGGDIARLTARYPLVYPSALYSRLAWAKGWDLVLRIGQTRTAVPEERETLDFLLREDALYRAVLRSNRPANDRSGAVAVPFEDPGRRSGIAILVPPRVA